jgi:hypothetical protein
LSHDRRFIEEAFPVREVSVESAKEKNIRHGHISTLHIWWARRPLASSRATAYAALIPAPKDEKEREEKKKFIVELSKWENSLNPALIERAREEILKANGGKPPKVLDPFAGGGAIPLEALRLGCEVYASDYNPVAVLIEKCTLEYPQKYGRSSGFGVRGSGSKEREGDEELQGTGGMEEGDSAGGGDIQSDQGIPPAGDVRAGFTDATGSCVDPGEHSGGMGKGIDEGIHPVSHDCERLADGIGDTPDRGAKPGLYRGGFAGGNGQGGREYRNDAQSVGQEPAREIGLFPNSEIRDPNPLLTDVKPILNTFKNYVFIYQQVAGVARCYGTKIPLPPEVG